MSEVYMFDELTVSAKKNAIQNMRTIYGSFNDDIPLTKRYAFLFENILDKLKKEIGFKANLDDIRYDISYSQSDFCFIDIGDDGKPISKKYMLKFKSDYISVLKELAANFELKGKDIDKFIKIAFDKFDIVQFIQEEDNAYRNIPKTSIEVSLKSVRDYSYEIASELAEYSDDTTNDFITDLGTSMDYYWDIAHAITDVFAEPLTNAIKSLEKELYNKLSDAIIEDEENDDFIADDIAGNFEFDSLGNVVDYDLSNL